MMEERGRMEMREDTVMDGGRKREDGDNKGREEETE